MEDSNEQERPDIILTVDEFSDATGIAAPILRNLDRKGNQKIVQDAINEFFPNRNVQIVRNDHERRLRMPSITKRVTNLAGAAARQASRIARGKQLRVPDQIARDRLMVCNVCPEFDIPSMSCSKCGCRMNMKTMLASESCPVGKWGAYEGDDVIEVEQADRRRLREEYNGRQFVYPVDWKDYQITSFKMFMNEANHDLILEYFPYIDPSLQAFRAKPNCGACRQNVQNLILDEDNERTLRHMISKATI